MSLAKRKDRNQLLARQANRNRFLRNIRRRRFGFELLEARTLLATVTWDGGAGTLNFGDALNWSNDSAISSANDYVIPDLAGTPTIVVASATVRSLVSYEKIQLTSGMGIFAESTLFAGLQFTQGTISANNNSILHIQGSSSWAIGAISGTGIVRNEGVLDITGSTGIRTINIPLENAGTINRDATGTLSINAGTLRNLASGVFQVTTAGTGIVASSGGTFKNAGVFRLVSSGGGIASFTSLFVDQGGNVESLGGHLKFTNHTEFPSTRFVISTGSVVESTSAADTVLSGTLTGTGGGKLRLHNQITVASGGATIATPIGMTESIANFNFLNSNSLTIAAGSDYRLNNPGGSAISTPLSVLGELVLDNAFGVSFGANATIDAAGKLRLKTASSIGQGAGHVSNYGEVVVDSGSHTNTGFLDNFGGTIRVNGGTLRLSQNSATPILFDGGNFIVAAGGQLTFDATQLWKGTFTGSGAGIVQVGNTKLIDVSGATFAFPTPLVNWAASGTSGGTLTVAAGSFLQVGGTLSTAFNNRVDVYGTVNRVGSAGVFINNAGSELNIYTGGELIINTINNVPALSGSGSINVYGTLRKVSTDNSSISTNFALHGGSIDVQAGTMTISGSSGSYENGNLSAASGSSLTIAGPQPWKGLFAGSGAGSVNKAGIFNIDAAGVTLNFPSGLFNLAPIGGTTMTVNGPGVLTVAPGSYVGSGALSKTINNRFEIYGTLDVPANSVYLVNNQGVINIKPGGLLQTSGSNNTISFGGVAGSTPGTVINEGTIRVGGTSFSMSAGSLLFDNVGTVDVQAGATFSMTATLVQQTGTTLTGGNWIASGTLSFPSGNGAIETIGPAASVTLNSTGTFFKLEGNASNRNLKVNQGTLTLGNNKSFSTFIGSFSNSGTIRVNTGATLTVPASGTIPSPVYTQTGGSTILQGGSVAATTFLLNGGSIAGTGTITANINNSAGVFAPGASPGVINVTGNYTQGPLGILNIEVGGTSTVTPDFDRLLVSGVANLNGTLNVSVINGFLPSKGETFRFMTFVSKVGDFATKNLAPYLGYPLFGTNLGSTFYDLNSLNIIVRNTNNSGAGSFRQAIIDANAASDADNILFNIQGAGPFTISPLSALPTITQPVTIDGYAQIGASQNTLAVGNNALLKVELNGASTSGASGLRLQSNDVKVKGLSVTQWLDEGIVVGPGVSNGVQVAGNFVGLKPDGITVGANSSGLLIHGGATQVIVGGYSFADRNLVSGNILAGVLFEDAGTTMNSVIGNYIGTDRLGSLPIGNSAGVMVSAGAAGNVIGGVVSGSGNLISGNDARNIWVTDANTNNTEIYGNYIGTNASGTTAIGGVTTFGILVDANVTGTRIGGLTATPGVGAGNLVSGHEYNVYLEANNSFLQGNLIGTNAGGVFDIGGANGVVIAQGTGNWIGGSNNSERNIISGHTGHGVSLEGATTSFNTVAGNYIGVNLTGDSALPNAGDGVSLATGAHDNTIGGTSQGSRNLISGNLGAGVRISSPSTIDNVVAGNFIGLDVAGTNSIGNEAGGVFLFDTVVNTIGGEQADARNVISGNAVAGIRIEGASAQHNYVYHNYIGTDWKGESAVPNPIGVLVASSAKNNEIGRGPSLTPSLPNLISGNSIAGVFISGLGTDTNHVVSNYIGVDHSGEHSIPNTTGVLIENQAGATQVSLNTISGNSGEGIWINGAAMSVLGLTSIQSNAIGLNALGNLDLGNGGSGVRLDGGSQQVSIGFNNISGNSRDGVEVSGSGTADNGIAYNRIGLDATGSLLIGNDRYGVNINGDAPRNEVKNNVISGNSAGIRNDGADTLINSNLIGTNLSGRKSLGNRRGSGANTLGHFGILSTGADAQIGSSTAGNVIAGHEIGIWLTGTGASGIVDDNRIGTDTDELVAMSNSIGMQMADGAHDFTILRNAIANSLSVGLRLIDDTSSLNTFSENRYYGNLGSAIDAGPFGPTLNDDGDSDGVLNFPVLDYANIDVDDLVLKGFVGANKSVEFYVSTPTISGLGQGATSIGKRTEGMLSQDLDGTTGTYGPIVRNVTVGMGTSERFEFHIPLNTLPPALRYGSLISAVALGSTSEFGNAVTIGDPASALVPVVLLPAGVVLSQGEPLRVQGSFRDDDSTSWSLMVDYGDGTGVQPLPFAVDRTFILEHEYQIPSTTPYQVIVTAIDNSNRVGVGVMSVSVNNEPPQPTFNSFTFEQQVFEGQAVTFTGAFTDSGSSDTHTVTIDWGDDTVPTTIALPPGARRFSSAHVYRDDGVSNSDREFYRIIATVIDDHGGVTPTPDGLYIVEVINVPPSAPMLSLLPASASYQENQVFALSGEFSDPGLDDTHVASIDWGDGSPKQIANLSRLVSDPTKWAFTELHKYSDNPAAPEASYTVLVNVIDDDEPLGTVVASRSITVTNELPSVSAIVPSALSINEGELFTLSVGIDDSGTLDSHQVVIDWGDASESKVFNLAPGVVAVPLATHRYINDPLLGSNYTIQVKVRDKDMPPGTFISETQLISVQNVAPVISNLQVFSRGASGDWLPLAPGGSLLEGQEVRIAGSFVDPGQRDLLTAQVRWSNGHLTPANVSRSSGTFQATFRYTDDYGVGTFFDNETIEVTLSDNDSGIAVSQAFVQVMNLVPTATFVPDVVIDPMLIPLRANASDAGADPLAYNWVASVNGLAIQTGTGPAFVLDRTLYASATIVVTLTVSDDDLGVASYVSAFKFGTVVSDVIQITTADFPVGVTTLTVLGLDGDDILNGVNVPAPYRLILDGGNGMDFLYGGGGDDIYILRSGNDSANVSTAYPPPIAGVIVPLITPNYAGNDRYYLKPNSTLTVVDLDETGENALDFGIASFGVEFNLATTRDDSLIAQEVALGGHFVAAVGGFNELVGSAYNDKLTGASFATTLGGSGADQLKAIAGTTHARFSGGLDADVFQTLGLGLSDISFEGDDGADVFTNLGELAGEIIFTGGADADVFTNLGGIVGEISFEGDDGADVFTNLGESAGEIIFTGGADADVFTNNLGGIVTDISFEGDDGADVFTNLGELSGDIIFTGGADADVFTNNLGGIVTDISFEGDDGADVFTNLGELAGEIIFTGGADADVFTNNLGGVVTDISFEGDNGADVFTNLGELSGEIIFTGGADADVFTNNLGGIVTDISFEGDDGADVFTNFGGLSGEIIFTGGADADVFTNNLGGIVTDISFLGDDGADVFTNFGGLSGEIIFTGGADADVFTNNLGGIVTDISFEGDDGADVFTNFGELAVEIIFKGGADADVFTNNLGGIVTDISFEGDDGADVFTNLGNLSGEIIFTGGADADVFTNNLGGIVTDISFEGDDGADVFVNLGSITGSLAGSIYFEGDAGTDLFVNHGDLFGALGTILFRGGADADVFINMTDGFLQNISFEGDDGADGFENIGDALGAIVFTGGADSDKLRNFDSGVASIRFIGFLGSGSSPTVSDDGADLFANFGDSILSISFEGDDGADVFQNLGDAITTISFEGDDGADVFVNLGDLVGSISFEGDQGSDVLGVFGTGIGSITFAGDSSDIGNDTLVNRSSPSATGSAILYFEGFGGRDALRNDGPNWIIDFVGGSDADTFQNNADALVSIHFAGIDGADVFENNGDLVSGVRFEGDDGADVFANGGFGVSDIVFTGGADADVFVNSGDTLSMISFEGDDGADIFSNLGDSISAISFEGDSGNDRVYNYGTRLTNFTFAGGAGNDSFFNRETATSASNLRFERGLGEDADSQNVDTFVNLAAAVDGIVFQGGAGADVFQNSGINVAHVLFEGDAGADRALNVGTAFTSFLLSGGDDADSFENIGDLVVDLTFDGGRGTDTLVQRGSKSVDIHFLGGDDADVFTNFGSDVETLEFDSGNGADRFQNNGNRIGLMRFEGGNGLNALQNNGDSIAKIHFIGGADSDTLLNNGSDLEWILFDADAGSNALINTGSNIQKIDFTAGADSDLFRTTGSGLGNVVFTSGAGDDAMIYNSQGTTSSNVTFDSGLDDDVLVFRGSAANLTFAGGAGQDRVSYSGNAIAARLDGSDGDDRYEFAGSPLGMLTIAESFTGASDTSRDSIDFSAFVGSASLDLNLTTPQFQPGGMAILLTDAMGIENVIGTMGRDSIVGNNRDNYLAGAQFYYPESVSQLVPNSRPTQWVLLDFEFFTDLNDGEHNYPDAERIAIRTRLEASYMLLNQSGLSIAFASQRSEIPAELGDNDFVTIQFNRTPDTGRPGGESSEIDFGNRNLGGTAKVQVNGLLGGIEVPTTSNEDFMEKLPEDAESIVGQDKPAATQSNVIALSAKLAAHELGHLLGLRHYDSFGPIGFGIHSPPGSNVFKPQFQGPSAAFETFDHIIGSPASIGSTRTNDVGQLFFGEREAVKLAFAISGTDEAPQSVWSSEATAAHNAPTEVQALPWKTISVPNTLARGVNSTKSFFVDTLAVAGEIKTTGAISENDYYSFSGRAGDVVSIEVLSKALDRYSDQGVDGYIDSVVRLYRRIDATTLVPVSYFNTSAENDDEFESSDSLLLDIHLPSDAEYVIEVDTFTRGPRATDPSPLERDELSPDEISSLDDVLLDTDVGGYELFVYRFNKASSSDDIDILEGRGGDDIIDGGPGDAGEILITASPSFATINEADSFGSLVTFVDLRGERWTLTVDYGDNSNPETLDVIDPNSVSSLAHVYSQNGTYSVSVRIVNNYGVSASLPLTVFVMNLAPTLNSISVTPSVLSEGQTVTLSGTITDSGLSDSHQITVDWGDGSNLLVFSMAAGVDWFSDLVHRYEDDNLADTFVISVSVADEDVSGFAVTKMIDVANLAPSAVINTPAAIDEGGSATILLSNAYDPSSVDMLSLRYAFALSLSGLAASYADAETVTSATFGFTDNGTYPVYARIYDKDGGVADYSTTVIVNNVAPSAVINTPPAIDEGGNATILLSNTYDPSSVDMLGLRYAFALSSSGMAASYADAGTANSASFGFTDNGTYAVYARIYDKDGGVADYSTSVIVSNIAPSAVINTQAAIDEGGSATITLNNAYDPSSVDMLSLRYAFAFSPSGLAASYADAGGVNSTAFWFTDNGTYAVYARIYDKDGGVADYSTSVIVSNVAPIGTFINSGPIVAGGSVSVAIANAYDPSSADMANGLRYSFSVNSAGLATVYGNATSQSVATFILGTQGVVPVYGRIFDKDGGYTNYTTFVTVTGSTSNTAPTLSIVSPTDGDRLVASTFDFFVNDPDVIDAAGPFVYTIQWGDGTSSTKTGGAHVVIEKTYITVSANGGVFTITATVVDARGASSLAVPSEFSVLGWTVMADPLNTSNSILVIVGSQNSDKIKLKNDNRDDDYLHISIRDREEDVKYRGLVTANVERILVFGLRGDDDIAIDDDIDIATLIWGGEGNDRIRGGGGNDVILGQQGDDRIYGSSGRDILIGGAGSDKIYGDEGEDILISGYTIYDQQRDALEAIMSEWGSVRDYGSRRQNILGLVNPTFASRKNGNFFLRASAVNAINASNDTVFDDGVKDELWGDAGLDWFFANLDGDNNSAKDQIKDRASNENSDDIDKWF